MAYIYVPCIILYLIILSVLSHPQVLMPGTFFQPSQQPKMHSATTLSSPFSLPAHKLDFDVDVLARGKKPLSP